MLTRLFVYGTLRSRFNNRAARLLRSHGTLIGPATVSGSIYRIGSYPGWKPEPAGEVRGELYELRNPQETLDALDEYEGEDFARIAIEATSSLGQKSLDPEKTGETACPTTKDRQFLPRATSGSSDSVWIYLYKNDPPEDTRIASGDFCSP